MMRRGHSLGNKIVWETSEKRCVSSCLFKDNAVSHTQDVPKLDIQRNIINYYSPCVLLCLPFSVCMTATICK